MRFIRNHREVLRARSDELGEYFRSLPEGWPDREAVALDLWYADRALVEAEDGWYYFPEDDSRSGVTP